MRNYNQDIRQTNHHLEKMLVLSLNTYFTNNTKCTQTVLNLLSSVVLTKRIDWYCAQKSAVGT